MGVIRIKTNLFLYQVQNLNSRKYFLNFFIENIYIFTVALNYQTHGLMMDLYNGFFRRNANCGYILKPAIMREEIAYFSANTKDVIPGVSPQILHIKVQLCHSLTSYE